MLKIENLSTSYKTIDGDVHVLKDINFEIKDNEIFGIAGESGCGKTTLLNTLYDIVDYPLVIRLVEEPNDFTYAYELEGSIEDKLNQIVQKVYGGKRVVLTANAQKQAKQLEALGFGNCPICVAKTQYSLTDDQTKLGAPTDFEVTVRNLKISAGAGFIVALTGEIMTMPGLPKVPAAEKIDVDETGKITGLF